MLTLGVGEVRIAGNFKKGRHNEFFEGIGMGVCLRDFVTGGGSDIHLFAVLGN